MNLNYLRLIRTSSGNIREGNGFDSEFKRGGLRATAGPRLAYDAIADKSRKKYLLNFKKLI